MLKTLCRHNRITQKPQRRVAYWLKSEIIEERGVGGCMAWEQADSVGDAEL